jgi:hypothetical protein
VVGYQQQRLLVASSPTGISLVSHLPAADPDENAQPPSGPAGFAVALQQMLERKT